MMLQILESGQALYALTAACILGLLSRLIARALYRRLIKETDNMALTKNRYLRDFKQKAENTYRLNQGLNNTQAYLEKQLLTYRFLGISLNGWGNLSSQMTVLCFLLGGAAAFASYWYRCDNYYIVLYSITGLLAGLVTLFLDFGVNLSEKKSQLLIVMQDYLENSLFNRLARETAAAMEDGPRAVTRENGTISAVRTISRDSASEPVRDSTAMRDSREPRESGARGGIRSIARGQRSDHADQEQAGNTYAEEDRAGSRSSRRSRMERKKQEETARTLAAEKETAVPDSDYLRRSLEQIAASREKSRLDGDWLKDLSSDELDLVGEIIKQYLA